MSVAVRAAVLADAGLIHALVVELAAALVDERSRASCGIVDGNGPVAGLALCFPTFSTFEGRHGLDLEDRDVRLAHRGRGPGRALLEGSTRRCRSTGSALERLAGAGA